MTAEVDVRLEVEKQAQEGRETMYASTGKLDLDNVTVGCEFEFSLAHHREPGLFVDRDHGKRVIRKALSQPLPVGCTKSGCQTKHKFQLALSDHEESDVNSWQVTQDGTIKDPLREPEQLGLASFTFYPIEIRSRMLNLNNTLNRLTILEDGHEVSMQQEITAVLNVLNRRFGVLGNGNTKPMYYPLITPKCGFHVHIGAGVHGAIPFSTVKRVLSTFIACERQIDGLHAQNRITGTSLSTISLGLTKAFIAEREHHLISYPYCPYNRPPSVYLFVAACIRLQQVRKRQIKANTRQKKVQEKEKRPSTNSPPDSTSSTSSDEVAVSRRYPDCLEDDEESKDVWQQLEPNLLGCDVRSWLNIAHHVQDARELREVTRLADK